MSHPTSRAILLAASLLTAALALGACGTDNPQVANAPAGNAPAGDAPAGDAPAGDAPAGDAPAGDAPAGGQAGDTTSDADTSDPCKLLTAAQAKAALKVDEVEKPDVRSGQCGYSAKPLIPLRSIGAGYNLEQKTEADLRAVIESGNNTGFPSEELPGIGDAAWLIEGGNIVHILVDGRTYLVTGLAKRAELIRAAKSVAANLG